MSRSALEVSRLAGQTHRDNRRGPTRDKAPEGLCPVGGVPGQMSRLSVPVPVQQVAKLAGTMRDAMPLTAALVDELRQVWGADKINQLISRGQYLRREHARILAVLGQAEADRWLMREQRKGAWFGAVEAGRQVGVMGVEGAPWN